MRIYQVADKKHYLPLLLLADEQNSMVDRYLDKSEMFVLDEDGVKGEIVVFERPDAYAKLKILQSFPNFKTAVTAGSL